MKSTENLIVEASIKSSLAKIKKKLHDQFPDHKPNNLPSLVLNQESAITKSYKQLIEGEEKALEDLDENLKQMAQQFYPEFHDLYQHNFQYLHELTTLNEMEKNLKKAAAQKELNARIATTNKANSTQSETIEPDPNVTFREFPLTNKHHYSLSIGQGRAKRLLPHKLEVAYQEDRATAFNLELPNHFNADEIPSKLAHSFLQLGMDTLQFKLQGSTCIATLSYQNKIYTIWSGDSSAFLVTKNSNGVFECTRLNWLHSPTDPDELQRIKNCGGFVENERVGKFLAVSRALGDDYFTQFGLSFLPSMSQITLTGDHSESFVLLCSDGVTDFLETKTIATILNNLPANTSVTEAIRQAAYSYIQNKDNISILKVPVFDGAVSLLADGHGGTAVCEFAIKRFPIMMQNNFIPEELPKTQSLHDDNDSADERSSHSSLAHQSSSLSNQSQSYSSVFSQSQSSQDPSKKRKLSQSLDDPDEHNAKRLKH